MQTLNLIQGSPEWHDHRRKHLNASDAPAMYGVSPYKTRNELLHEMHTGLTKEVDSELQSRFDDGHYYEALGRPLAASIIGATLYPVTGTNGQFSASFDGITMDELYIYEHKSLNNELRAIMVGDFTGKDLPIYHRVQMEQQLMVSGAEKVLFMASKWEEDKLVEERHCWYEPDLELRNKIVLAWAQFEKDLAEYVPEAIKEKPKAEQVESFPVPSIIVRGELVACNLEQIIPVFDRYFEETKTELVTDQDFADGEANAKNSREAAKNLKLKAKEVVDQIATVSEVVRQLELYAGKFDALGLKLEKAVKEQKEAIKNEAISAARLAWQQHVASLQKLISPINLVIDQPDFAASIKGVKTIKSLKSNISDALADGKIQADALANELGSKLAWFKETSNSYQQLFADMQQIIYKPLDDFQLLVNTRVREEQERKTKEAADALLKSETPEPALKLQEVIETVAPAPVAAALVSEKFESKVTETQYFKGTQPTAEELITAVAFAYKVDQPRAQKWLQEANFFEVKLAA